MAGVLSDVMYCPLTAVFLIAEITNGYELIYPFDDCFVFPFYRQNI
ncbi:MAG: hypothetical protein IPP72_16745 [Chitinophagaceae bacterium]|nr:hypothetical protein [Chitinophagaceae bacterium]